MNKTAALTLFLLTMVAMPAAGQDANTLTSAEKAAGWRLLFNGTSLDGWRAYGRTSSPTSWRIENGLLKTLPKVKGGDNLITVDRFDDFEFSWEWRVAAGANNGVKYFVTEDRPEAPGHEYQMIDDVTVRRLKLGPLHATASFYDVLPPAEGTTAKPAGEWNLSRVVVQGNRVEHWLNGKKVLEYQLGSEAVKAGLAKSKFKNFPDFGTKIHGHIMLTYHNDECWYRNLKIREIPSK